MSHIVTCRWCKEKMDLDRMKESDWTMPSRNQYYHTSCYDQKSTHGKIRPSTETKDDFDSWRQTIFDFILRDLKGECNYARVTQQLKEYKNKNKDWTYKGMFFALKWFYEIEHNDWNRSNGGIGILPYIYYDGTEYWRQREKRQQGIVASIEKQMQERANRETITVKEKRKERVKQKYSLDENYDE